MTPRRWICLFLWLGALVFVVNVAIAMIDNFIFEWNESWMFLNGQIGGGAAAMTIILSATLILYDERQREKSNSSQTEE